tara:strand:- start:1279 stop:2841 length:1563 start_codon:yes stop_codon:yes gene_type:complete
MKKLLSFLVVIFFSIASYGQITSYPHNTNFESSLGDWLNVVGDDFDWTLKSGSGTPSSGTGPQLSPYGANSSSGYVFCESSSPNYPNKEAWLECVYDFSALSSPQISIYYHMYSSYNTASYGPGTLQLDVYDGSAWTMNVWSNTTSNSTWQTTTIDLAQFAGMSNVKLSWTGYTIGWQSDISLDELSVSDNTSSGGGGSSNVVEVGDPNSTLQNGRVPAYGYYDYSWSAAIYHASDFANQQLDIDKISWNVTNGNSMTMNNQEIWFAHTPEMIFLDANEPLPSLLPPHIQWVKVYDGTINFVPGWNEITLQTYYPYNGTDNLLIKVVNEHGSWASSYPEFQYTSKASTVVYNYDDGSYPTGTGYINDYRPNTRFGFGGSALPIELLSFDAWISEEVSPVVTIEWEVASQVNNSHYTVLKSSDGFSWSEIAKIPGAGTTNTQIDYSIKDDNPRRGWNYYKLKQTDYDGQWEEFEVVSVGFDPPRLEIIRTYDQMGREVKPNQRGFVIQVWDNGEITKTINE